MIIKRIYLEIGSYLILKLRATNFLYLHFNIWQGGTQTWSWSWTLKPWTMNLAEIWTWSWSDSKVQRQLQLRNSWVIATCLWYGTKSIHLSQWADCKITFLNVWACETRIIEPKCLGLDSANSNLKLKLNFEIFGSSSSLTSTWDTVFHLLEILLTLSNAQVWWPLEEFTYTELVIWPKYFISQTFDSKLKLNPNLKLWTQWSKFNIPPTLSSSQVTIYQPKISPTRLIWKFRMQVLKVC